MSPDIIFTNAKWVALSKPAGWLTVPGRDPLAHHSVLSSWLKEKFPEAQVVHRLDRETSGLILFARGPEAHREASLWFENRKVKKTYDFLAQGSPLTPVIKCDQAVNGQASLTQIRVQHRFGGHFLGEAQPVTGRRHQIRIHLSQQGFPIWGDPEYGGLREISGLPDLALGGEASKNFQGGSVSLRIERVALHARSLRLPDGTDLTCPWPKDFAGWAAALGAKRVS